MDQYSQKNCIDLNFNVIFEFHWLFSKMHIVMLKKVLINSRKSTKTYKILGGSVVPLKPSIFPIMYWSWPSQSYNWIDDLECAHTQPTYCWSIWLKCNSLHLNVGMGNYSYGQVSYLYIKCNPICVYVVSLPVLHNKFIFTMSLLCIISDPCAHCWHFAPC